MAIRSPNEREREREKDPAGLGDATLDRYPIPELDQGRPTVPVCLHQEKLWREISHSCVAEPGRSKP